MSKICPQCKNQCSDETKFCTACGASFAGAPDNPGSSARPETGMIAPDPQPGQNRSTKILIGAGMVVILVIAVFLLITGTGFSGVLPSSGPPGTVQMTTTPAVTSTSPGETPLPEQTLVPAETLDLNATITSTPKGSPSPAKPPTCPSDRRLCGTQCADIMNEKDNCGACGVACTSAQTCQQGICRASCSFGEMNCPDGCHNLSFDALNCGTCGNTCPFGLVCNRSVCGPPVTTVIPTYIG